MHRINIGCGISPTTGWENYDNSLSVAVARLPILKSVLRLLGFLDQEQLRAIKYYESNGITVTRVDASKKIPKEDKSVSVIYSSHMIEHLDRDEARAFLTESFRVLEPGGILRLAVPDLLRIANEYVLEGDADRFLEKIRMNSAKPKTWRSMVKLIMVGPRHHQWMYDAVSLCRLLTSVGFENPTVMPPGSTTIPDPGDLDLYERSEESLYVEAHVP